MHRSELGRGLILFPNLQEATLSDRVKCLFPQNLFSQAFGTNPRSLGPQVRNAGISAEHPAEDGIGPWYGLLAYLVGVKCCCLVIGG